jgi:hypothetical protein
LQLDPDATLLLQPDRVVFPYSWLGHIPFAFFLVSIARPRVLVELGSHTGNSFTAFCQAVKQHELSTRCYAIDTWQGDLHAGFYPDRVYQELLSYQNEHFAGIASLIRSTFDDALEQFSDNSIDILHIDGLHTYEAVKHDFESWLPKLSERAIVLFHDTNVRERGFGVYRLWKELVDAYQGFEFLHSNGLGVLATGSDIPVPVQRFLNLAEESPGRTRELFARSSLIWLDGDAADYQRSLFPHEPDEIEMVPCELFFSDGGDFTEEQKFIEAGQIKGERFCISFTIGEPGNSLRYRLDPGNDPIVIRDLDITVMYCDGESGVLEPVRIGNISVYDGALVFLSDPWIELQVDRCISELHASFTLVAHGQPVMNYIKEVVESKRYLQKENDALREEGRRLWDVIKQKDEMLGDLREEGRRLWGVIEQKDEMLEDLRVRIERHS